MTGEEYTNEKAIKFFIITNKNIPIVATKEENNIKRVDYLQVLLNKYFKETTLNKYIGKKDNNLTEEIITELVNENNIILSNVTPYNSIQYKTNNETYANIYINVKTTKEQIETIINNKDILQQFDYFKILIYRNKKILKTLTLDRNTLNNKIEHYQTKKRTLTK